MLNWNRKKLFWIGILPTVLTVVAITILCIRDSAPHYTDSHAYLIESLFMVADSLVICAIVIGVVYWMCKRTGQLEESSQKTP